MKISLRALALIVFYLAIAGIVISPDAEPVAVVQNPRSSVSVEPVPLSAGCPGALIEIGGIQGTDLGSLRRVGEARVAVHGAENPGTISRGAWFSAAGADQSTNLLSANQSQAIKRPRLGGLAAVNCPMPTNFGYLVAGSSGPGNESVLLLGNPNNVEVSVELEFYLSSGNVLERVPLAAGEQKQLALVSFSNAEPSYVMSYRTTGLPVSAFMQHRSVAGLTATGVAVVPPQLPQLAGEIAGLEVDSEGFEPVTFRAFNPGLESAQLKLELFDGQNTRTVRFSVPSGAVVEEPLDLKLGNYLVFFESDQPLVLAALNKSIDPARDFAWLQPMTRFSNELRIPLPKAGKLFIANPGANAISVRWLDSFVEIQARSQRVVDVEAGSVLISSSGEFGALLSLRDATGYAVISPSEMKNFGDELSISVR
jgi:hypothetical protein